MTPKLFAVYLGGRAPTCHTELHALAQSLPAPAHTDDLHDVDDCLEIGKAGTYLIQLQPTDEPENFCPTNGYHLIPKQLVQDYLKRKSSQNNLDLISPDC